MAEPSAYLVVALSGRALAVAAHRAGHAVVALDLFGDADTRASATASEVVAGDLAHGFDADALLAAAERLAPPGAPPPFGLVYGSGLEDRPQLLAALARGRQLCGNPPAVVARTKDPRQFFELLRRLAIPCPETRFDPPATPEGWLMKRIGASGGSHVVPAPPGVTTGADCYYQRRVGGRPIGVSFLADGRSATLLGFSEQWASPAGGGTSFLFGGALQPAPVDPAVARAMPAVLDQLAAELALVGLNSLDMLVDDDRWAVIEVNPRPGANLDIFDAPGDVPIFELHLRACAGDLPAAGEVPQSSQAAAMAVVYAERRSLVPADVDWPDWVADRPAPGATIEAGAPVCTVLARASGPAAVRRLADARAAMVSSLLQPAATAVPGMAADMAISA